jgi:hypothetical protein
MEFNPNDEFTGDSLNCVVISLALLILKTVSLHESKELFVFKIADVELSSFFVTNLTSSFNEDFLKILCSFLKTRMIVLAVE